MDHDEQMRRGEVANAADPTRNPWGAMIGGDPVGLVMFSWYPTEQALHGALSSGEHALDMEADEWEPTGTALAAVLADPQLNSDDRRATARSLAMPAFDILWWGQFEELCTGNSETAVECREDFLAASGEPESASPRALTGAERSSFGEYLHERYA